MSNLYRFTARPCSECPDAVLIAAIADWLMSPERFRHGEAEKDAKTPGRCLLCGAPTRDAFAIMSDGEVKGVAPTSQHMPRFLEAWRASDDPKVTDATGRTWRMFPVFFCDSATKPNPCLFSRAEVETRRRKREAMKQAEEAERASYAAPAPKTKTSL